MLDILQKEKIWMPSTMDMYYFHASLLYTYAWSNNFDQNKEQQVKSLRNA